MYLFTLLCALFLASGMLSLALGARISGGRVEYRPPGSSQGADCRDAEDEDGYSHCPDMEDFCDETLYEELMHEQCPYTCDHCDDSRSRGRDRRYRSRRRQTARDSLIVTTIGPIATTMVTLPEEAARNFSLERFGLRIVPNVVANAPERLLSISYANNTRVEWAGIRLTINQTREQPTSVVWEEPARAPESPPPLYTLMMTDTDHQIDRNNLTMGRNQFHHWTVLNIPGSDRVIAGDSLARYIGPAPPPGTGEHRYLLLVFRQRNGTRIDPAGVEMRWRNLDGDLSTRGWWTVREFAATNGLEERPVAGNFLSVGA